MNEDDPPLLRALPTLAAIGIRKSKAYTILNSGVLPAVKIGLSTFIRRADWNDFVARLPKYAGVRENAQ